MATKVPVPKFHNITGEKFKRQMEDAAYFDPFYQPPEEQGAWWARALYWIVVTVVVFVTIGMILFPFGEAL